MNARRIWIVAALLAGLLAAHARWTPETTALFCRPAAALAGLFLNAPVEGTTLLVGTTRARVTPNCSGMRFFLLLTGLCAWRWLRRPGAWRWLPGLVAACYAATLAANTARVVLSVMVQKATLASLGEAYTRSAHLAVGVLVFLPLLILATLWMERTQAHAN